MRPVPGAVLLQQAQELVPGDSRVRQDAAERAALDVLCVDGNRDYVRTLRMGEVMMATLRSGKVPALLLQDPDQLPGTNRRQPVTHAAAMVMRSISAG